MAGKEEPELPKGEESQADLCPTIRELQRLLDSKHPFPHHVDEVWPNLYLADLSFANNRYELWKLGITHVLNAAHGRMHSDGSPEYYGTSITYHGVPANDLPDFDISQYFYSASEFIHEALNTLGARVLVHCVVGISRSASLVLAYLMIHHQLSLTQAIQKVQENRWIFPNAGFLQQLLHLDEELQQARKNQIQSTNEGTIARDKKKLKKMGITHILNVAHASWECTGDNIEYGPNVQYYGITAEDCPEFDISVFLRPGAKFIHNALSTPGGKILVHCVLGKSRSATMVLAYLMIYQRFTLADAIRHVSQDRCIAPNRGFLQKLQQLEMELHYTFWRCYMF